jgi:hypothetical protein
MFSGGSTRSTIPVAIALRGMPSKAAVSGFCAMTMPPSALMKRRPRDPLLPVPDRMMAIARGP